MPCTNPQSCSNGLSHIRLACSMGGSLCEPAAQAGLQPGTQLADPTAPSSSPLQPAEAGIDTFMDEIGAICPTVTITINKVPYLYEQCRKNGVPICVSARSVNTWKT